MSTRAKHIRHAATAFCMLALSPLLLPAAGQSVADGASAYQEGDYATALENFRPLAERGDPSSQWALGLMYNEGHGVLQDYVEAVRWYRLSAEQGHPSGQYSLGARYGLGQGVPKDYATSYMWGNIAAANGAPADLRDTVAKRLSPEQIVEAQRRARVCMQSNYQDCD